MVRCMALSLTSACRVLAPGARLKNEHMSTSSLTCGSPAGSLAGAAKYPEVGPSRLVRDLRAAALGELCAEPEQAAERKKMRGRWEKRKDCRHWASRAEEASSTGYLHPAQASPAGTKQQYLTSTLLPTISAPLPACIHQISLHGLSACTP